MPGQMHNSYSKPRCGVYNEVTEIPQFSSLSRSTSRKTSQSHQSLWDIASEPTCVHGPTVASPQLPSHYPRYSHCLTVEVDSLTRAAERYLLESTLDMQQTV